MSRCAVCGKEYKKAVSDSHVKTHKISRKKYAERAGVLSEELWEFYWTHPGMQKRWPDAAAEKPPEGRAHTFRSYMEGPGANLLKK